MNIYTQITYVYVRNKILIEKKKISSTVMSHK